MDLKSVALFALIWLCQVNLSVAQEQDVSYVKSGIYATEIYDIDFQKEQFDVQFWIWFIHENESYLPWERTEVINAKSYRIVSHIREHRGNQFFDSIKMKAVIRGEWDINDYPFDQQVLTIDIEDNQQTGSDFRFLADQLPSGVEQARLPHGWTLRNIVIASTKHQYGTTFGDPNLTATDKPEYSRLQMQLTLEREGNRLFIVIFIGFILAWLLTILVYASNCWNRLASVMNMQDLLNICIGALFAAMSNSFTLSNLLPYTTYLVLADHFQIVTLANLIMAMLMSIWTHTSLHKTYATEASRAASRHKLLVLNRWITVCWFGLSSAYLAHLLSFSWITVFA
ncbi:hypothetical protein KIH87_02070 [Paraneptunicella aestuarii]|uniref:hypothetical protein n=1 Tax=Paraneptunicella aestuarii TaxID=2831148 RepID=UPI001E3F847A|nr:hypothetical protein [Paraneptunicella aestuarii]UAA39175.1 hypothetical protein KIH87_02070 [Paraneptunicella aestuarii]